MNTETLDPFFDEIEKKNGVPIVISMWGFKKVTFQGKVYLISLTEEESKSRDSITSIEALEDAERPPKCTPYPSWCARWPEHCGKCERKYTNNIVFTCACTEPP